MQSRASAFALSNLPVIKAIVFDWDGCLLDNFSATYRTYHSILLDYKIELDKQTFIQTYSPDWYKFYKRLGLPRNLWSKIDEEWDKRYLGYKAKLRKNALDVLKILHDRYSLLLLTGGTRERVFKELGDFGLRKWFSFVICREDSNEKKPNPAPLLLSLKLAGVEPLEALYVGDTYDDVAMGRKVGCITALIQSSFTSTSLKRTCPHFKLKNLVMLLQLVAQKKGFPK